MSFSSRKFLLAAVLFAAPLLAGAQETGKQAPPQFQEKTAEALKNLSPMVDAKNYDGAITLLGGLLPAVPADSYDRMFIEDLLGKLYWQGKNDPTAAIEHFSTFLELVKAHPDYYPQKDKDEHMLWLAEASYQKATSIKNNPAAQRAVNDEAIRYLKLYLDVTPKPAEENMFLYAMLLYQKASATTKVDLPTMRAAEEATRRCLKLDIHPKPDLYQLLVATLVAESDYKQSADYFELLVKLKPTSKDFWGQLFQCYSNLANTEEKNPQEQRIYYARAINAIERAQALGIMKEPKVNLNLVYLYNYVGQFGRATELMKAGLKNKSIESTEANWILLSYFYQQVGDNLSAINSLKDAAEAYPTNSDFDFKIASMYQEDYNTAETYKWCKSAIKKNNFKTFKKYSAYQYLAFTALELQKYDEALDAVRSAIKIGGPRADLKTLEDGIEREIKQRDAAKRPD